MHSHDITMVCFDWGGVILRICRSWQEGCTHAGLPLRADLDRPESATRRRAIAQAFQVGEMQPAEFYAQLSRATDGAYTPAEVERIHQAWLIEEYAGVADLIEDLRRVPGLETGLLSNTNHEHWRRHRADECGGLACFPTIGRLQHRHASHLLRLAKPAADIYHAFARETGHMPGRILFFDDLDENIAAARGAGWQAERVDHTGDTAAQMRACLRERGVL